MVAGRKPTVDFYDNLTYFIPGTLAFKGFKTVAVGTAAGVAKTKLEMSGLGDVGRCRYASACVGTRSDYR